MENHVRSALVSLYPRLRRFAVALTGSSAEGDDLVQHACERALARTYQWHPGTGSTVGFTASFRTPGRMSGNRCVTVPRRQSRRQPDTIGDDGVRRAEARLTLDNVYRKLCNLPEEQRAVLMLVCVDGLSYKEVAEILSIPVGTVMSRVARGRLALADRIEAAGAHSADNILKLR